MSAGETDAEVIASSLERPERFELIFDRHGASIHRYLRRRVGDSLAEELTAETFMRALRGRNQFDTGRASALPWLYRIAINLVRMHMRSEQRGQRAHRLFAQRSIQPSSTAEVEARLDAQALGPALAAALSVLTPDQREVLLLNAWAELSPVEIAEALGLSTAAARKRLHRARRKAAGRLKDYSDTTIEIVSQTRTAR